MKIWIYIIAFLIFVLSLTFVLPFIADLHDTSFYLKMDELYVKNWEAKYRREFLEKNPGISCFNVGIGYRDHCVDIQIRGRISKLDDLESLLGNIKSSCHLLISDDDDMGVLRLLKSDAEVTIGDYTVGDYEDGDHAIEYDNSLFLKNTKMRCISILENVVLKSLEGIEECNAGELTLCNAEKIKDFHLLKQTGIYYLLIKNAQYLFDLKEIGQMEKLRILNIVKTKITSLVGLENNKTITSLHIDGCQVSDLSPISKMKSLEWLYLGNMPIDDLSPLVSNDKLEIISISKTNVKDLTPLAELPNLKNVFIYNAKPENFIIPQSLIERVDIQETSPYLSIIFPEGFKYE